MSHVNMKNCYDRCPGVSKKNKNKNKPLYLSVTVFSTAVLIEDTVNSETNIINQTAWSWTIVVRNCGFKSVSRMVQVFLQLYHLVFRF